MNCILFESGTRLIVDTSAPMAHLMHDTCRPYALCQRVGDAAPGRVTCIGRYETLLKAKRALYYR